MWQKRLNFYCQDDSIDVLPLAFLDVAYDIGGLPSLNFANICNIGNSPVFPGTELPDCSFLASDIQECQAKGKIVTLSIGGSDGVFGFVSDSQAEEFADTIWDLFLGGSSSTRPFGSAILDGIDLDLEGGSVLFWPTFVNQIRSHESGGSKKYYITGSPQCAFPDAYLGPTLNAVVNNYCGLQAFNTQRMEFCGMGQWAKTVSPNKDIKIYIGAAASPLAATSGYVDPDTLASCALNMRNQFSSFAGIMLWDASWAYANRNYAASIKRALSGGGGWSVDQKNTQSFHQG
ncbi:glycoside hydrolase superfamily [Russula aff. rugulosa BPL654]|nr:glycoside hydrolase superfamily [Russula aff. rugulosa BPL654]